MPFTTLLSYLPPVLPQPQATVLTAFSPPYVPVSSARKSKNRILLTLASPSAWHTGSTQNIFIEPNKMVH